MSGQIDAKMVADWRINYGLDTRTPAEAMRWWHDNMDGKAPAGAVAALGLCIDELERLRADAERLDWLTTRLEDVQIDGADPNDHYYGDEEHVPYPVLWRRAIDAASGKE